MANPIGYSFAPTFQNAELAQQGATPGTAAQQALQTLTFKLKPKMAGAPGLSPLQGSERVGSSIGEAVLASVLRTVLGIDAAALLQSGSAAAHGDTYSDSMRRERNLPGGPRNPVSPIAMPGRDPGLPEMTPGRPGDPTFGAGGDKPEDVPMLPDGSGNTYGDSLRREQNLPQFSDVRRGSNKYGPDGWMDDVQLF